MAEISPFFDQVGRVQSAFFTESQLLPTRLISQKIRRLMRFNLSRKTPLVAHGAGNYDVITKKIRKNRKFSGQKIVSRFFKNYFSDL